MYSELKQMQEALTKGATESDLQEITMILSSNPKLILKKLKDSNFRLRPELSISVLISKIFEELRPDHLKIKFRCVRNLENLTISELFETEFRDILEKIEDVIFDRNSEEIKEILLVCSGFISITRIPTLKKNRFDYINSIDKLSDLIEDQETIIKMIENNKENKKIVQEIFITFRENEKMLERFASSLVNLGHHEISAEIFAFIDRFNSEKTKKILEKELTINSFDDTISLKVVSKLDDIILNLILSSDILIKKFICIRGKSIPIPEYDSNIFRFQEFESNFNYCQECFYSFQTHSLFDFEKCFCVFLSKFLINLTSYEFFGKCYYEFLERKRNFFKKLYKTLKNQHKILTQTILQKILTFKNPDDEAPFLQFLNRASTINCSELDSESFLIFRRLLNEPILQSVLSFFNTSSVDLNNELDSALRSVYLMDLPEGVTGITLWTLQIVIKPFISKNFKQSRGAIFFVLLHELAYYLQRASCSTVSQSKEIFSSNLLNDGTSNEAGFILEKKLFGDIQKVLTLKQAEFLLAGRFSNDIEIFQKDFNNLGMSSEDTQTFKLERGSSSLYLESCGSRFISGRFY